MKERTNFRLLPALVLAGLASLIVASGGCSAANDIQQAQSGCSGLSTTTSQADAAVKAWADALGTLNTAAAKVEGEWLQACNDMNRDLGLDVSKTTAQDACAVLKTHIQNDLTTKGVKLVLLVSPPTCEADVNVQASCEGSCKVDASCDVSAHCMGGDVVVGCMGTCSAQCDVTAPSFACNGTCKGECTASAAVSCMGECTGQCDAPMWSGTCDAGCTASFSGTCGGKCTGTCDGAMASGTTCAGKCAGTCDAKATGTCAAQCTGMYSGGQCSGHCTGKCNVAAGAMCSGTCNGTCSYTPGSATCSGQCHGTCSASVTPPTCTGTVDCMGSAECHADCQAKARANFNCSPPQVTLDVEGDDALLTAFQNHLAEIGTAYNETLELASIAQPLAQKTEAAFSAIGAVSVGAGACIVSQASVASSLTVHIQVSVSASATVSGQA